ncbi:MAG: hypothetical protein HYZ23_06180 [Chloroflexi bacterium]|nr:hypothetical protein [Chloroflexota bacterium]
MNTKLVSAFLALALASMACGVNLPEPPTPGPEVVDEISVAAPDTEDVRLNLSFGAGEISLEPGAKKLVEGTATYNYSAFKPEVTTDGSDVRIQLDNPKSLPPFNELKNEWDFKLGDTPMDLRIEAGAYQGVFDFGGLSLNSLSIQDGAAEVDLTFSEPNPVEMSVFHYETGASNVKMTGLGNANFSLMDFSSGMGDYTLDFSGELQRDASITISSGLSNIILVIPEGVNAVVTVDSGASNVSTGPGWSQNGTTYKQKGDGPTLTIVVNIGAGNLSLTK